MDTTLAVRGYNRRYANEDDQTLNCMVQPSDGIPCGFRTAAVDWPHLLCDIQQVPLGCGLDDALSAYGEPYEQWSDDDLPDTQTYSFEVQDLHLVQIWVWKSAVHQILFTSPRGDSSQDLQTVFDAYGGGEEWTTWTKGYRYASSDDSVRVWCSAMPVIGVGTKEFVHFRESLESDDNDSDN